MTAAPPRDSERPPAGTTGSVGLLDPPVHQLDQLGETDRLLDHEPAAPRRRGRLARFFRGRDKDPAWVRPALLTLLALTAVLYLWDLGASGWANSFYSAAVQAGSKSWKAFFFGCLLYTSATSAPGQGLTVTVRIPVLAEAEAESDVEVGGGVGVRVEVEQEVEVGKEVQQEVQSGAEVHAGANGAHVAPVADVADAQDVHAVDLEAKELR